MPYRQYHQQALEVRVAVATVRSRLTAHAVAIALLFLAIVVCLLLYCRLYMQSPPVLVPASANIAAVEHSGLDGMRSQYAGVLGPSLLGTSSSDLSLTHWSSAHMSDVYPMVTAFGAIHVGPENLGSVVRPSAVQGRFKDVGVPGLPSVLFGTVALALLAFISSAASLARLLRAFNGLSQSATRVESSLSVAQQRSDNMRAQYQRRLAHAKQTERKRIAEELHNSTQQHLVAIELYLMQVRRRIASMADVPALLDNALASAASAQKELRTFSYLLFPAELTEGGLAETVRSFAEGFAKRTGLVGRVHIGTQVDDIPMAVQKTLLWVIQEALLNIHRHADATSFRITLALSGDRVTATIQDNGHGFVQSAGCGSITRLGVGISAMRSRLRSMGGGLVIESGVAGTRVCATVGWAPHRARDTWPLDIYAKAG